MIINKKPPFVAEYETERLYMRILPKGAGKVVLDYYNRNIESIKYWEPEYLPEFYTTGYQDYLLECSKEIYEDKSGLSLWLYLKEGYSGPIGHISFLGVSRTVYQCCSLGYKLDKDFTGWGYATEAVKAGMDIIYREFELQRIEATILPENEPSIKLIKRCGFTQEGIVRSSMFLRGQWRDHLRFSHIRPETYKPLTPVND